MVFRKWLPVLAVLALLLGMTVSANAQCTVTAGGTPTVRAEGITELVGDVLITCTPSTAVVGTSNVQIFLNTNITSKVLSTSPTILDALLLVDNLGATAPGPGTPVLNSNLFEAQKVSDNAIAFFNVPVFAPGTTHTYRITNVRANANQVGTSSSLIPNQIVMFISTSGSQPLPISQAQVTVAFVQSGLTFATRKCDDSDNAGSSQTGFSQCASVNKDLASDQTKTGQTINYNVRYSEGFGNAFKVLGFTSGGAATTDPNAVDQNIVGGIFNNSESGFTPSLIAGAGKATTGTRFIARFANIPAGVSIFVTTVPVTNGTSTTVNAALVSTSDPTGASGSAGFPVPGTGSAKCAAGANTNVAIAPVTLAGGAGAATWEITDATSAQEMISFGVVVAFKANTPANSPTIGTGQVVGNFAPISTVTTAAVGPIPRFADVGNVKTAVNIVACFTNILFPFVTNQGGFDTGVAISNTSQDIFATDAQTGTCTINYFGSTAGGGAAPSAQTSAAVPAGGQLIFTLSTGGNLGITSAPGFQGYIIANCKFQLAHGFAFISDVGAQKLAQGYLGLILTNGTDTRGGSTPEALNN